MHLNVCHVYSKGAKPPKFEEVVLFSNSFYSCGLSTTAIEYS